MRIGIIDADLMDNGTRHPNLALMKIAGYYKEKGDQVKLIYKSFEEINEYDKVFISKVFNFTKVPEWVFEKNNVNIGGTGFYEDGGENLPDEIEHHMPWYDLYIEYVMEMIKGGKERKFFSDYLDYSIGFTTRGCFRKCSFCVNKKYDRVQKHSYVSEFLDDSRPNIYLWDDNILAYPKWEEILDELEATGRRFQFRQGIDLRLMTDRMAYRFNNTRWHGDFIFAFDHLKDKDIICNNVQLWKKYTNKQPKMYVLSAYESQDENDIENAFERIRLLMKYGCLPYIMRYEKYSESKYKGMYIQLARWCNQPQFYKKMSFREFCERNQFYHHNKNTLCSAYRAMIEFEHDFPDIARKYFDLKFMFENLYTINYGFGQRYSNKPECKKCKNKNCTWNEIMNDKIDTNKIIQLYLEREINLRCLLYENSECIVNPDTIAGKIIEILLQSDYLQCENQIMSYIEIQKIPYDEYVLPTDNFNEYMKILELLYNKINLATCEIMLLLEADTTNKQNKIKENLKVLAIMDLIYYSNNNKKGCVEISSIGKVFWGLETQQKDNVFQKLSYRLPLVQEWIRCNKSKKAFQDKQWLYTKHKRKILSFLNKSNEMYD